MASSSHAKEVVSHGIGHNPIAFKLSAKEGMTRILQPTSSDEVVIENWQRQMVIPFVVDKKLLAFHGPLADQKYSSYTVAPFSLGTNLLLLLLSTDLLYSKSDLWR